MIYEQKVQNMELRSFGRTVTKSAFTLSYIYAYTLFCIYG